MFCIAIVKVIFVTTLLSCVFSTFLVNKDDQLKSLRSFLPFVERRDAATTLPREYFSTRSISLKVFCA